MAQNNLSYKNPSPIAGNGLFATQAIAAGGLICSLSRPLVAVLDQTHHTDTCANCFATYGSIPSSKGLDLKACTGCRLVRYCGKACQTESWKRTHKSECPVFRRLDEHKRLPNAVRAVMDVLSRRKGGRMSDAEWNGLMELETHLEDIRKRPDWQTHQVLSMGALKYSLTEDVFDMSDALGIYARVLTNSLTVVTPTFDPLGLCLDPLPCSANHSCNPNAYIFNDGSELIFRALKHIAKDEEIFISYIDCTNPYHKRQEELRERYYFDCACSKCCQGPSLREDKFKTPTAEQKDELAKLSQSIICSAEGPAHIDMDDFADSLNIDLGVVESKAFAKLEEARKLYNKAGDSSKQVALECIKLIENGMELCAASGVFPMTRQPYAALRDELIVDLMTVDRLVDAWKHATCRYLRIDPVLYPMIHHPVRVVRKFLFATLTMFLITSQADSSPVAEETARLVKNFSLELGTVLFGLLAELGEEVKTSHGLTSRFASAVYDCMKSVGVDPSTMTKETFFQVKNKLEKQWKVMQEIIKGLPY